MSLHALLEPLFVLGVVSSTLALFYGLQQALGALLRHFLKD